MKKRQSNVENPFVKNLGVLIVVVVLIIAASTIFKNMNKPKNLDAAGVKEVSQSLGTTLHGVEDFSSGLVSYLKASEYFGPVYASGKKIVLYPPLDANSRMGEVFMAAFEKTMADPSYSTDYTFMTFDSARESKELYAKCHNVCIINPNNAQLFYLGSVGPVAAEKLPVILNGLKSW